VLRWQVTSGPPLAGTVRPAGDKSITHRAFLLALLARGTSRISHPNPGADAGSSLACARVLGARVTLDPAHDAIEITGCPGGPGAGPFALDCGNSGTTLRLLAGLVARWPLTATLTGDESLKRRPVARVIEPLRLMGATLEAADGGRTPPLTVRGGTLRGIDYAVPMASAQVATAVLLAGLGAEGPTRVTLPGPARDHTERMLPAFGVALQVDERADGGRVTWLEGPATPTACDLRVPGDFSSAAFFLAAAAATPGARVTAQGVSLNPTRTGLLDVLERMGATVERLESGIEAGEPVGEVTVTGPGRLQAFDVPADWLPRLLDEVPAWVVAASAADGISRVRGAGELRVKESDRLAALAGGLGALGIACEESPDGLAVTGGTPRGGTVDSRGDHRIAMTFAVLGARVGDVTIEDCGPVATSYPGFADGLRALGGRIVERAT
jgi:3-phosphoshikimate 1-carboxyvinyltransferase